MAEPDWLNEPEPHPVRRGWMWRAARTPRHGVCIWQTGPRDGRERLAYFAPGDVKRMEDFLTLVQRLWQVGVRGDCGRLDLTHVQVRVSIRRSGREAVIRFEDGRRRDPVRWTVSRQQFDWVMISLTRFQDHTG